MPKNMNKVYNYLNNLILWKNFECAQIFYEK